MLKMLRFDFYKIFKSKALLSVFIVTLCLAFLDPALSVLIMDRVYSPFLVDLSRFMFLDFFIFIFVVPFVCKDFSSKYIKNTYSSYSFADKIYYVLSKIVYIFAICVIWFLLRFVSHLIVNLIQSAVLDYKFKFEYYDPGLNYGTLVVGWSDALYKYFCMLVNCFAKGMFCMFLCMLFKREYIVIVLMVLYWMFLTDLLYGALCSAMGQVEGWSFVRNFTIYGMADYLPGDGAVTMARLTQNTLVSFGYSGVFAVLGWLCFFKRSY